MVYESHRCVMGGGTRSEQPPSSLLPPPCTRAQSPVGAQLSASHTTNTTAITTTITTSNTTYITPVNKTLPPGASWGLLGSPGASWDHPNTAERYQWVFGWYREDHWWTFYASRLYLHCILKKENILYRFGSGYIKRNMILDFASLPIWYNYLRVAIKKIIDNFLYHNGKYMDRYNVTVGCGRRHCISQT